MFSKRKIKKRSGCVHRLYRCFFLVVCICVTTPLILSAQPNAGIDVTPGMTVPLSSGFAPTVISGVRFYPEDPLRLDFLIEPTDDPNISAERIQTETQTLINYFFTVLTVPENNLWVNLSPQEKDRIMPAPLSQTQLGKDLLELDYQLKQTTASMLDPHTPTGELFWQKADPATTINNKVWILPDTADIFVEQNTAFITKSHLKVQTDIDYQTNAQNDTDQHNQLLEDHVLPQLEQTVNQDSSFARLKQIYHSLILATWLKQQWKNSFLEKWFVDQNMINGFAIDQTDIREKVYEQYLLAFQKGAANIIREDYDPVLQHIIPRQYFSGGIRGKVTPNQNNKKPEVSDKAILVPVTIRVDHAQLTKKEERNLQSFKVNGRTYYIFYSTRKDVYTESDIDGTPNVVYRGKAWDDTSANQAFLEHYHSFQEKQRSLNPSAMNWPEISLKGETPTVVLVLTHISNRSKKLKPVMALLFNPDKLDSYKYPSTLKYMESSLDLKDFKSPDDRPEIFQKTLTKILQLAIEKNQNRKTVLNINPYLLDTDSGSWLFGLPGIRRISDGKRAASGEREGIDYDPPLITISNVAAQAIIRKFDKAQLSRPKFTKGGIDLNPNKLSLTQAGTSVIFQIPKELRDLQSSDITGFSAVITDIMPVKYMTITP